MTFQETQVDELTKTSVQVIIPCQLTSQEEYHPVSANCTHTHQKVPEKDYLEQKTDELCKSEQDKQVQNIQKNVSIKPIALEKSNITSNKTSNKIIQIERIIDHCPNNGGKYTRTIFCTSLYIVFLCYHNIFILTSNSPNFFKHCFHCETITCLFSGNHCDFELLITTNREPL